MTYTYKGGVYVGKEAPSGTKGPTQGFGASDQYAIFGEVVLRLPIPYTRSRIGERACVHASLTRCFLS